VRPARIFADVKMNIILQSRFRGRLVFSLVLPVALMLLLGTLASPPPAPTIKIVDEDHSTFAANLTSSIRSKLEAPSAENLTVAMEGGYAGAILLIPNGTEANVTAGQPTNVTLIHVKENAIAIVLAENFFVQVVADEEAANSLHQQIPVRVDAIRLGAEDQTIESYRAFVFAGMLGLNVLGLSFMGTVNSIGAARRAGVLKKLATTPMSKAEWLVAKLIVQFLLVAAGTVALLVTAYFAFPELFPSGLEPLSMLDLGIVLTLGTLAFSALGLLVASLVRDPDTMNLVAGSVYAPMMLLSGTFVPTTSLPVWLRTIARGLPLTYFTDASRIALSAANPASIPLDLGVLAATVAVGVAVGSKFFQWTQEA